MAETDLNNLVGLRFESGDLAGVRADPETALALRQGSGNFAEAGSTLHNLGAVCSAEGDAAAALAYFEQALTLRRQIEDVDGQARMLANLALVWQDMGDLVRAETLLVEAVMFAEQYDLPRLARNRKALTEIPHRTLKPEAPFKHSTKANHGHCSTG